MKFRQLTQALIQQIESGSYTFGQKLLSIRDLQQQFTVSKNTVLRALQELESLSYITAKPRQGFYVCWQLATQNKTTPAVENEPKTLDLPQVFHEIMAKGAAFDWFPTSDDKFCSKYLTHLNRCIFNATKHYECVSSGYYDAPQGLNELRQQVVQRYQLRNYYTNKENVVITSGCQNALYLALSSVTNPGDTVAVESPTFYGVLQILETLQLKVIEVGYNELGTIDVQQLEHYCKNKNISACVLTPSFATPSGRCISEEDKMGLVRLAEDSNFYIIEDDIYGELGLLSNPPPLASYDKSGRVLLCGSWSKSLSRDLRLGWVISNQFIGRITNLKLNMQLASPITIQAGLAQFIAKGDYRRHLSFLHKHLAGQLATLVSELKQFWPSNIEYEIPKGGLALWVKLPETLNTQFIYQELLHNDIVLTPGILFSSDHRFSNYLRLSFLQPIINERKQALRFIGKMLKTLQNNNG